MWGHKYAPRLENEYVIGDIKVAFELLMLYEHPLLYVTSHPTCTMAKLPVVSTFLRLFSF